MDRLDGGIQQFGFLPDVPEERPEALWEELSSFADHLSDLVASLPSKSPLLLSGDWGAGKTTLLKAVERKLTGRDVVTIWFEAWRYDEQAALLPALIRSVWQTTPPKFRGKDENKEIWDHLWSSSVAFGLRLLPTALSAVPGLGVVAELFKNVSPSGIEKDVEALRVRSSLAPSEDPTEILQEQFRKLTQAAWPEQKVVLLVDDLDRCTPDDAMALLNGIRLLIQGVNNGNCSFIVALDRKVMADAVQKKFEGISSFDGNRYLEKLFPISFDIPAPSPLSVATLVETYLKHFGTDALGDQLSKPRNALLTDQQDALSETLSDPMFSNPRLMKRCINRFRLISYFEWEGKSSKEGEGAQPSLQLLRDLSKWIAASERWPTLRRLVAQRDDHYWADVSKALHTSAEAMPDQEAKKLFDQVGVRSWVQREMLSRDNNRLFEFRKADQILRKWGL